MKKGLTWAIPLAALFLVVGMVLGAAHKNASTTAPVAMAKKTASYAAPEVSIMAQPMPMGTTPAMLISQEDQTPALVADEEKPKKRSHHRRHKRTAKPKATEQPVIQEDKPDEEIGLMAADDVEKADKPRHSRHRKHKDESDDWKNWIQPSENDQTSTPADGQ